MRYDTRVCSKARKSEFSSAWPIVAEPWETLADLFACVKVSKCFKSPSPIWNAANTLKQALLSKEKAAPGPLQFRRSLAKAQHGMLRQLEDVGCWMINRIILRSRQNLVLTLKVQIWLNVTDGFVNRDDVTSVVHKSHIAMDLLCVQSSFKPSRKTNNYVFLIWMPCGPDVQINQFVGLLGETNKHILSLSITFGKVSWQQTNNFSSFVLSFGNNWCNLQGRVDQLFDPPGCIDLYRRLIFVLAK